MKCSQLPHTPATTARAAATTTTMPVSCSHNLKLWSWANPPSGNTVKTLSQQWLKKLRSRIGFRKVSLSSQKNSPKGQDQRSKGDKAEQVWKTDELWPTRQWCRTYRKAQSVHSLVIQAAFGLSLSCDLGTYAPHPPTHRRRPLFMGGSSSLTLIRVFPVQLPAVFYAMGTLTTTLLPCRAFLLQEPQTWRAVSEEAKGTK